MNGATKRLDLIMRQYPLLTMHGFGEFNQPAIASPKGRMALRHGVDEVRLAHLWLERQTRIQRINASHTSYGLKHLAEHDLGHYISNGAFIAAAVMSGWKVQRASPDSPNACINISERCARSGYARMNELPRGWLRVEAINGEAVRPVHKGVQP